MKKNITVNLLLITSIFSMAQTNIAYLRASYQSGAANYNNTAHLATDGQLSTFWKSRNQDNEWIYTDLGFPAEFSAIRITWGETFATDYVILISSSGIPEKPTEWKAIYNETNGKGKIEEINTGKNVARFVKILIRNRSNNDGCIINEFEITGKKHFQLLPDSQPKPLPDGSLYLTGGNWKLQRQSFVKAEGSEISMPQFQDNDWVMASIPGTVLYSYINIGAVPDPNYADQQLMISDEFFTANFWYRNTLDIPSSYENKQVWLNFDGINWKADVYFNGNKLGRIEGAYIRAKFNISHCIVHGKPNSLAVLIYKNDNPGEVTEQHLNDPDPNGGIIGYDSPTILASIGWNWMPTIRGRNCGIWNNVFLSVTNAVNIIDPFIKTHLNLPDTSRAEISIETTLKNNEDNPIKGILKGYIGEITFEQPLILNANETKLFYFKPSEYPQLIFQNPLLWWPNGYGNQNLYNLKIQFVENGTVSDQKIIKFGIREYSYVTEDKNLRLHINGFPLIVRGGNWGMPESMMRCDSEGYDLRVKLHKDMNLNMIRNWIGMTGNDEFYNACDKYGIMIWDDFWLANPVDGPVPVDNQLFINNARDKIFQKRNHASLALWCGRNEGYPPVILDSAMRAMTSEMDGTRFYISSSAHQPVTGLGPYEIKDPVWYFTHRGTTFHSEQGIVCVPSEESMRQMMPDEDLWPISDLWGKHDWTQPRVKIYTDDLNQHYGAAKGISDFCRKAQMMNMEGPKAMIESWQSNRGPGVLVWMTHPAWPSLICQTYDYYFEPTATYFAFKNASEPLHILWRADNNKIQVSNNTLINQQKLTASIELYDFSGQVKYVQKIEKDVPANTTVDFHLLKNPERLSKVFFIKLQLKDTEDKILSRNFYWSSENYQDYTLLDSLPKVLISDNATITNDLEKTTISVSLKNTEKQLALMIRLKVLQSESGKRVLPIFYSDNYISLVPGESRTISIEFKNKNLEGEKPKLMVEGWNIIPLEIKMN